MRIGIDVRYLSHGLVGGVHTYIANFLPALIEQARNDEIVLYADTKRPFELPSLTGRVTIRYLPWKTPLSSLVLDLTIGRQMARDRIEVAHFPANYGFASRPTRTVLTLHDSINILPIWEIVRGHPKRPGTLGMMSYLHVCTRQAVRRADAVVTVSRFAAEDIARRAGLPRSRVIAIPHAPTPDLRPVTDPTALAETRRRLGIERPFVLADALKNPAALAKAWRRLPAGLRRRHQIVFFSRQAQVAREVHGAVSDGDAVLLVRPSRADLVALYSQARAFVFPSWIEGFGLPVLEAMTCGSPVIASSRGAIPEVAGGAALLFDVDDLQALATHLEWVLLDSAKAEQLRRAGVTRAAQFSWARTAELLHQVYRSQLVEQPALLAAAARSA